MYGQIRLLYIIGLSILIQLILQLLKGLLFGFSISLESHSCWQYRRIKSFLGLIQRLLVHEIEKGHTMLIGCYLKVGLPNQIYNYDETPKDMIRLSKVYQENKNWIGQYCSFSSILD